MSDDLRDFGAKDFLRYEKVRRVNRDTARIFNTVTNSSAGTLQIDPIVTVYNTVPGFFASAESTFEVQTTNALPIAPGFSALFEVPDITKPEVEDTNYVIGIEVEVQGSVDVFVQIRDSRESVNIVEIAAGSFPAPSGPSAIIIRGDTFGAGAISDVYDFRVFGRSILPPFYQLEIEVENTDSMDQTPSLKTLYLSQPAGLPYGNPAIS